MSKQSGWDFFVEQKWQEHETEVQAWDGHLPTYTKEEYVKKNYKFLNDLYINEFEKG